MLKKTGLLLLLLTIVIGYGCATQLEKANKGAEKTGEPVGKVLRIPGSAAEGTAGGIAGEAESNPYNR
ncbi:hypothetical protein MNBD_DELTA01-1883 [hydrothermal vent metagenome]|uniref:Uncharacterized protein n=1 Tax=hydrothermal vent metagenome TaxID=652676 RepID=A0A3B0RA32_9ZZZZ